MAEIDRFNIQISSEQADTGKGAYFDTGESPRPNCPAVSLGYYSKVLDLGAT